MANVKTQRLAGTIQKALTQIISREVKDPSVGLMTITAVELTGDQSIATIYVTFMGNEKDEVAGMEALNRAKTFIRRELAHSVKMRAVPNLVFKIDTSFKYGTHIEQILQNLK